MESIIKFLVFVALLGVCSSQFTCTSLPSDLAKCGTDHLSSKMPELAEMLKGTTDFIALAVLIPHWKDMCMYPDDVKNFFTCSFNAIENCADSDFIGTYPTSSRFIAGFDYACSKVNDVDIGCYQINQRAIHECAMTAAGSPPASDDIKDIVEHNCRIFEAEVECTSLSMTTCEDSRNIIETYLGYLTRPACSAAIYFRPSLLLSTVMIFVAYFMNKQ
ncbi:hypothetical protein SNE40_022468 [Patella caerulea]|uniref:Uncharacterized protein n=1 Tax=Patella caerulea TaxID=87958 RepID=A0AAN8FWH0_PATCE